ncbi:MAG: hypothetical protein PHW24_01430 [Candidatus Moranbacteria bacterium]|nr:hypothetical protein [Candidatus Moranbacteria bacterium]
MKSPFSKTTTFVFLAAIIATGFWSYVIFKNRNAKESIVPTRTETFTNDSSDSLAATDDLVDDGDSDNNGTMQNSSDASTENQPTANNGQENSSSKTRNAVSKNPVSVTPEIKGSKLANITPEHCSNDCQAFSIDLKLFEYCQQSCGISPIKNVSNCDDKKDIQKDYCLKDLAITKKDLSACDKVSDGNIKQSCKNRIEQDAFENLQQTNNNQQSEPTF